MFTGCETLERNGNAKEKNQPSGENLPSTSSAEISNSPVTSTTPPSEILDPFHPSLTYSFPKKQQGKQSRSCQAKWFQLFPWLHYNRENDSVLCFTCMREYNKGNLSSSTKKDQSFLSSGYRSWKDALQAFREHERSNCHRTALTFQNIVPLCGNVAELINENTKTVMEFNRKCLIKIIESLQFFARQGIAVQGKTDAESNFIQLLKLRSKDVPILKDWLNKKTDKYTAHDIQNEILSLMSNAVVRDIIEDIKKGDCDYYSLIADEYADVSNKEQLSLNFRWLDDDLIANEDFIGFYEIPDIAAETITNAIEDVLTRVQLSLDECRGQCYDGASNMLGKKSGVAKRIQDKQPKAFVTHCHCHSLSLSVKDAIKESKLLTEVMGTSKEIVVLIKYSPKREKLLGTVKENIEHEFNLEDFEGVSPGIATFSATRWTVKAHCFKRIYDNYAALLSTWDECLSKGGLTTDVKSRITGCQTQMKTFNYFFGLLLGQRLFSHTDNLSAALQSKKMSALSGQQLAFKTIETLRRIRSDEAFNLFYDSVLQKKKAFKDVGEPEMKRNQQCSPRDHYRRIYFESVDLLVTHIQERFEQPSYQVFLKLESLLLKSLTEEPDSLEEHISEIKEIYDEIDEILLPAQLGLFRTLIGDLACEIESFDDILEFVRKLSKQEKSAITQVIKIIQLIYINPCSSATGERSFSIARRIKTWLRSTMTPQRFNSVSILTCHKMRTDNLDLVAIANLFVCNENRFRQFGRFTDKDL